MKIKSMRDQAVILTTFLSLILAGCNTPSSGDSIAFSSVDCHVFYRATAGEGISESPTLSLSTDGDMEFVQFEDIGFRAVFLADEFEGQSLSIVITNMENQQELTRSLFQIDQEKGLSNQFIGGHGFTGLGYVFHPTSDTELQYFCEAR